MVRILANREILILNAKSKDKALEIFKIQVDDIILPWVADGVRMYWSVPIS